MVLRFEVFKLSQEQREFVVHQYAELPVKVTKTEDSVVVEATGTFEELMCYFARGMHSEEFSLEISKGGTNNGEKEQET